FSELDVFGNKASQKFIEYNGRLYFKADDGTRGTSLWVTDGTQNGTSIVEPDVAPSQSPLYSVFDFVELDGSLYFKANYDGNGYELWKLTTEHLNVKKHTSDELTFFPNPVEDNMHM